MRCCHIFGWLQRALEIPLRPIRFGLYSSIASPPRGDAKGLGAEPLRALCRLGRRRLRARGVTARRRRSGAHPGSRPGSRRHSRRRGPPREWPAPSDTRRRPGRRPPDRRGPGDPRRRSRRSPDPAPPACSGPGCSRSRWRRRTPRSSFLPGPSVTGKASRPGASTGVGAGQDPSDWTTTWSRAGPAPRRRGRSRGPSPGSG